MIEVGDLVRLTERTAVKHNNFPRNIGLVIDFVGLQDLIWGNPDELCAKVQWMGGGQTVTGLPMLERVEE